jgi:hypothetical protein
MKEAQKRELPCYGVKYNSMMLGDQQNCFDTAVEKSAHRRRLFYLSLRLSVCVMLMLLTLIFHATAHLNRLSQFTFAITRRGTAAAAGYKK